MMRTTHLTPVGRKLGYRRLFAPLILGGLALGACADGENPAPGQTIVPGDPDQAATAALSVDEASVTGTNKGNGMALAIPVTAGTAGRAQGELSVMLTTVDGTTVLALARLPYDLGPGVKAVLTADLALPAGIVRQSPLSQYNVRIEEPGSHLVVRRSLLYTLRPYEIRLEGAGTIKRNKTVRYRVLTQDPTTRQPLPDYPVTLQLVQGGQAVSTLAGKSDPMGVAVFEITAPSSGTYQLMANAESGSIRAGLEDSLTVQEPGIKVLLTTDKPVYQPGQVIHLRSLSLSPPNNLPVANQAVIFEVEDAKGNKLLKRTVPTDAFGIAAFDFRLGSILNQGTFKLRASLGEQKTEKTVEVSRYALPKFSVSVSTDQPWYAPGKTVTGIVDAGYFFGKRVAGGQVTVEAMTLDVGQTVFQRVQGQTNSEGRFSFTVALPGTLVGLPLEQGKAVADLRVTVIDTAGQEVTMDQLVTIAAEPIEITLVPESGQLVAGVANRLLLFATDPEGAPVAGASVTVSLPEGGSATTTTDAFGQAQVTSSPVTMTSGAVTVELTPPGGSPVTKRFNFAEQVGGEHVIVRTDKAVYQTGEAIKVEIDTSNPSAPVYVDWLNDGQAVDMRSLQAEGGVARFSMPVDTSLLGSNRIEAYVVDPGGNLVRAGRTIFARDASSLSVRMSTDQPEYAPGQPARLTFSVTDDQGNPAVAALGVQIVDQAVFALVDAKPGLLETYFQLEDAFSKPQYEIEGPHWDLSGLLFHDTAVADPTSAEAAQARTQAALAALGNSSVTGIQHASWAGVVTEANGLLQPYFAAARMTLVEGAKLFAQQQVAALAQVGCQSSSTSSSCGSTGTSFVAALKQRMQPFRAYDFWGNAWVPGSSGYGELLRLVSNGPDEKPGTSDDHAESISYAEAGISDDYGRSLGTGATGSVVPGAANVVLEETPNVADSAGDPAASGDTATGTEARVRKDFPETLYVNPAIITGADGTATLEVPMADSITEWRVSTLANSASGKLGSGVSGVRVFQDFFVDVDFPATLTRGDTVEFPIVVYNYLDTAQTVDLALDAADWYTPLGATSIQITLGAGEVKGTRFPVRVDRVGLGTLTVRGNGSKLADAVARTVRVVSDGKNLPSAVSGSLGPGTVSRPVSFPAGAIAGSEQLYLNVYPAYLSQVVAGMDSMLRVPSGCFEQTTSSTWPNVLVTRYMQATGQITPEIQIKAESLISAGYQRLLTFEHPGGGFSWFGTQDPAPFLSVTAFGLMEFADMAQTSTVDDAMVTRTRQWLLAQQASDGSWTGDNSEFFDFPTSKVRNTAFTLWALASAGYTGGELATGLGFVKSQLSAEGKDSYSLALVANALALIAPSDPLLTTLLDGFEASRKLDGDKISWDSAGTQTNFYASGDDAAITTTALVTHAMLQAGGHKSTVDGALKYLAGCKDQLGNFGSTQATVWTLRTLLLAATKGTEGAVGTLEVAVDGQPFTTVPLRADQSDVMTTVDLTSLATSGDHQIGLTFVGSGQVSYNLVSSYNVPWANAPSEPSGPLSIKVGYDKSSLYLNDTVTATVDLVNRTASEQNMVLVTLGIPPGFQVLGEDLDDYVATRVLSQYEHTAKQLTLYVAKLAASVTQRFVYRLQATMPVKASDGGAEVYPYYEPKRRSTAPAATLEVLAD